MKRWKHFSFYLPKFKPLIWDRSNKERKVWQQPEKNFRIAMEIKLIK